MWTDLFMRLFSHRLVQDLGGTFDDLVIFLRVRHKSTKNHLIGSIGSKINRLASWYGLLRTQPYIITMKCTIIYRASDVGVSERERKIWAIVQMIYIYIYISIGLGRKKIGTGIPVPVFLWPKFTEYIYGCISNFKLRSVHRCHTWRWKKLYLCRGVPAHPSTFELLLCCIN